MRITIFSLQNIADKNIFMKKIFWIKIYLLENFEYNAGFLRKLANLKTKLNSIKVFFTKYHCLSYGTQRQYVWCSKSPVRPVWFLISLFFLKVWKGMLCRMNFFEFAKINWTWICRSTDAHWLPPKRPETNTDKK